MILKRYALFCTLFLVVLPGTSFAYTYVRSTLTMPQPATGDGFGSGINGNGIAMSADGHTLLVGAPGIKVNGNTVGGVFVYTKIHGAWTQTQAIDAPHPSRDNEFGGILAL